jgi:hypothetical protein
MINEDSIKLVRLITGEELLAEQVSSTPNLLTIKNPIRVMVIPNKSTPQSPTVGFAPWQEFSENTTFTLDMAHVLVIMKPIKEFRTQYINTFSKIITPQSGLILP